MAAAGPLLTALLPPEMLATLLEQSPDCLVLLDRTGQLRAMNQGGLRALEADDLAPWQRHAWHTYWPPPHDATVRAQVHTAFGGATTQFQGLHPTAQGTPKWWDVTLTPLPNARGEVEQLLAVMRELTAERALLRHHLNTLLTVVHGEAQLLRRRLERAATPDASGWRDGLARIGAAAERLRAAVAPPPTPPR